MPAIDGFAGWQNVAAVSSTKCLANAFVTPSVGNESIKAEFKMSLEIFLIFTP